MPNATLRADARTMPKSAPPSAGPDLDNVVPGPAAADDPRAAKLATRDAFDLAYSSWLAARAGRKTNMDDDTAEKLDADLEAAEREVMLTPALYDWMVWDKLEILTLIMEDDLRNGERADNFSLVSLAAIKSDLIRLGIGGA
jgi:hypothetical protein